MVTLCSLLIFNRATIDVALFGLPVLLLWYLGTRQLALRNTASSLHTNHGLKQELWALAAIRWDLGVGGLAIVAFGSTVFTSFHSGLQALRYPFAVTTLVIVASFAARLKIAADHGVLIASSTHSTPRKWFATLVLFAVTTLGLYHIVEQSYDALIAQHTEYETDCSVRVPALTGLKLLKEHGRKEVPIWKR